MTDDSDLRRACLFQPLDRAVDLGHRLIVGRVVDAPRRPRQFRRIDQRPLLQRFGQALDHGGRRAALAMQQHDAKARETLVLRMDGRCRQGRQHRCKDNLSDGKAQSNPANQWRKSAVSREFVTPAALKHKLSF